MSIPTLSVIIPVYNCERYIQNTVQSIIKQPNKVYEIILINDGSVDSSGEICVNLEKEYPNVLYYYQENSGVSVARNRGIDIASGDYIAFCDADDAWCSGFFNDLVLDEMSHCYDIIGYQHYMTDSKLEKRKLISNSTLNEIKLGGTNSIWAHENRHIGAMLFRTEFLKHYQIVFPKGLKYNEDEIFKCCAECLSQRIYLSEHKMYLYRVHKESSVHNLDSDIIGRYETWMGAWNHMDTWLWNNCKIKTRFGTNFAEMYFIEMCIVYTQSLKPLNELKISIDTHKNMTSFQNMTLSDYPQYMQKDVRLFNSNLNVFFAKHRMIGYMRYLKRLLNKLVE